MLQSEPSTRIDKGGGNTGTGQLISAIASAVSYAAAHNVLVVAGVGDGGLDLDHAGSTVVVPAQSGSALGISATAPVGYAVGWPNGATNFSRPTIYTNFGRSAVWVGAPGGDNTLQSDSNCRIPKVPSGVLNFPCYVFDEVVAPGYVTPTLQVDTWNTGTAVAAAHVAGVAALIKQKYPGILVGDLKAQLAATADGSGGADAYLGHGFLNARRAVTEPLASAAPAGAYPAAARPAPTPRLMLAVAPQPVRGAASFAVTLPREGIARLELFDVAGRSVAVVFDGIVPAGRTVLSWDGRGRDSQRLKPGAYLAGVVSGGIKTARTLVVVGE